MTLVLRMRVLAVGRAVALADGAEAETGGATAEGDLRVRWSDTAMADGWRSVCGDVWNEGQVPARGIVNPGRGPGERGPDRQQLGSLPAVRGPAGSRAPSRWLAACARRRRSAV